MMRVLWRWRMGIGCVRVIIRVKVRRRRRWVAVGVDNDRSVGVVPRTIGVVHGSEWVGEGSVRVAGRQRRRERVVVVVLGVGEGEGRHGAGRRGEVQGGSCLGALE